MITDEMMAAAAAELNEALINSLPDPRECRHRFSKEFERKMEKLIFRVNHPIRYKVLSRVACILLAIMIGFMIAISCSSTVRAAVFGWVKKNYDTFYAYYFDSAQDTVRNDTYQIDPLPEGFTEIANYDDGTTFSYVYSNSQNDMLVFSYSISPNATVFYMEKECYLVEQVILRDKIADLYISKDGTMANGVIWTDEDAGIILYISGLFDRDELINLLENVRKINKVSPNAILIRNTL